MLEITGTKFLISLCAVSAVVIFIIALLNRQMKRKGHQLLESDAAPQKSYSKQYAEVNVFAYASTLLRFGMVVSLVLVIFAFNWTTYEREIYIPEIFESPLEIEVETPRSPLPPPPPPPPPPPEIVEVLEEEVIKEQENFIDQTVEETDVVDISPLPPTPPKPPVIVTPPTPPPPPIDDGDDVEIEIDLPLKFAQQMPRFDGCEDLEGTDSDKKSCAEKKMLQYIYGKIKYPTIARENNIEGLVVIGFIIEKDGSISNPQILRDLGGGCGKEALRVISQMPNWIPGYQRARPVRVQFNMPVKFKLEG